MIFVKALGLEGGGFDNIASIIKYHKITIIATTQIEASPLGLGGSKCLCILKSGNGLNIRHTTILPKSFGCAYRPISHIYFNCSYLNIEHTSTMRASINMLSIKYYILFSPGNCLVIWNAYTNIILKYQVCHEATHIKMILLPVKKKLNDSNVFIGKCTFTNH